MGFAAHVAVGAWIRPGRDAARTMASKPRGIAPPARAAHAPAAVASMKGMEIRGGG